MAGIPALRYQLTGATVTGPGWPPTCPDIESWENVQAGYTFTGGTVVATTVVDPRGKTTRYTFNPAGYTTSITDHLGQTTTMTRESPSNLVTEILDPLNRTTRFGYDTDPNTKNLLSITRYKDPPANTQPVTRSFTYDTMANHYNLLTSVTTPPSPVLRTWTYGLDAAGKTVTSITDPLGHVTDLTYNGNGQPMTITTHSAPAASQTTTFDYDLTTGFLTTVTTSPDGSTNLTTTYAYDQLGRRVRVTDPRGARTRFSYDLLNRVIAVTDPLGRAVQFAYDPNSNLTSVTDPRGGQITYAYNNMDQLTTRTDPLLRPETLGYDIGGNLTSFTDRKNQQTTWDAYDDLNRPAVVRFKNAGGVEVANLTYGYDAANRVQTLTDSVAGAITWRYDALDRLTSETTAGGTQVVTYVPDDADRRASMTVSGQPVVTYTWDNADRLTQIALGTLQAVYGFDNANRRTSLQLPNLVTITYGYDDANRLTGLTYSGLLGGNQSLTYSYDPAGNRTVMGGSWARTLLPDAIPSASYDAANRQLTLGTKTMAYDFNGNLATLTEGVNQTTYTWDVRNRLTNITGPGLTASFAYDAIKRRTQKTINSQVTTFQYDGADIVRESVGATPADYLRGLSIDEPLARIETAGKDHYLPDALGSGLALSDDGGNVTTSYTYGAFGQTVVAGAVSPNTLQYTGRENDGTGLYYYRARFYHPGLSRFISEDPLGFRAGDVNLYRYVTNRPTIATDPLGLWRKEDHERLTREVAKACGLSEDDADVVAEASRGVDEDGSVIWPGSRRHAMPGTRWKDVVDRQMGRATGGYRGGDRRGALTQLGIGSHTVQDAWAHDLRYPNQGTIREHIPRTARDPRRHPDRPDQNPDQWELARIATMQYIQQFMRAVGLKPQCGGEWDAY